MVEQITEQQIESQSLKSPLHPKERPSTHTPVHQVSDDGPIAPNHGIPHTVDVAEGARKSDLHGIARCVAFLRKDLLPLVSLNPKTLNPKTLNRAAGICKCCCRDSFLGDNEDVNSCRAATAACRDSHLPQALAVFSKRSLRQGQRNVRTKTTCDYLVSPISQGSKRLNFQIPTKV